MLFLRLFIYIYISVLTTVSFAETLTPENVLQKVIDHYPSVNIAAIEIERARQSIKVANSQLGWQLNAQAGIERGASLFGSTSDTISMGAGISRMLESGSSLAFEGGVRREDSETAFGPVANPATSTNFSVSYRQSLVKNTAYSTFQEAKVSSRIDLESTLAERDELYDQLAFQVIELYFSAAVLLAKIDNIDHSVERAERLQRYITNKTSLGISEEKDILQVNAQRDSLIAEKRSLETLWKQQMVSLNRLMQRPWDSGISTTYKVTEETYSFEDLFSQAKKYSPKIKLMDSKLAIADSAIRTRREEREDALDLVWFAGGQNNQGDASTGSVSETDLTGGLRLEFKESIDKSGVDAKLYQAQLERSAVLQDRKLLLEDLHYDMASLLAEIEANKVALNAYAKSHRSEEVKVDEAIKRYRTGRIDTDVLISFEDQLSQAKFSFELQKIALVKRHYKLQILLGELWQEIKKPVLHDFLSEPNSVVGAQ